MTLTWAVAPSQWVESVEAFRPKLHESGNGKTTLPFLGAAPLEDSTAGARVSHNSRTLYMLIFESIDKTK